MIETKKHLQSLYRTTPEENRSSYLRLDRNESVNGIPNSVVDRITKNITPELLARYPEYNSLKEKLAKHCSVKPENIFLANGSDSLIKLIYEVYLKPHDIVLMTNPTFAMYLVYCDMFQLTKKVIDYKDIKVFPTDSFSSNLSKSKLAVVVNPNNPTGSIISMPEMILIIQNAKKNNCLVIIDEAYYYFYPKTFVDLVSQYDNVVVLRTFSKFFGLASLRLGFAIANPTIIENLKKVQPTWDVNGVACLFAEKLLDSKVIKTLYENYDLGKEYLCQRLKENNIEYVRGNANFVLIKCEDKDIISKLYNKNVLVGGPFKQPLLKSYIRVTTGNKTSMGQFMDKFLEVV